MPVGKLRFSSIRYPSHREHNSDPTRDLNNFLQGYKDGGGNLARHFSWFMQQEGPDHQKIHHATAKCEPFGHSL